MSGQEKDEGRGPTPPPNVPMGTGDNAANLTNSDELAEETVFLHPRFDPAPSFIKHHKELAQALESHPYPGILAAVADPDQLKLTWIAATTNDIRAAIIGRHNRATLSLPQEHSTAALRHMVMLVTAEGERPIARLLDLQTESGFADPLGRRLESIRTNGCTFVSVAGTVLMLLPTGPHCTLHADPQTAWNTVPPQRWVETRANRHQPTTLTNLNPEETIIEIYGGPQGCRTPLCKKDELPLGLASIASGGDERHLRISGRALDEGFLIGRYDRCEVGGPEADESLSRVHLLIVREKQKIIAVDTASTNGTFIGEARVHLVQLKDRSTLDLGGVLEFNWRLSN
ncbi:MAG: FHA domain-containing protein [Myxococcales bacterium]|nr:FHA domain-containing protein [Myxococcales bacterium]